MSEKKTDLEKAVDAAWCHHELMANARKATAMLEAVQLASQCENDGVKVEPSALDELEAACSKTQNLAAQAAKVVPNFRTDVDLSPRESPPNAESIRKKIADFLNPEVFLRAEEQLDIIYYFLGELGLTVPEISKEQLALLDRAADGNRDRILVPTPLCSNLLGARKAMTERAGQAFSGLSQSTDDGDAHALLIPLTSLHHNLALKDPKEIIGEYDYRTKISYRTADGSIVDREVYLESLVKSGDAVKIIEDNETTYWIFPLMELQTSSANKTPQRAGEQLLRASHVATPESLIIMQLLHRVIGTKPSEEIVRICNEFICQVSADGTRPDDASAAVITTVCRDSATGEIVLGNCGAGNKFPDSSKATQSVKLIPGA